VAEKSKLQRFDLKSQGSGSGKLVPILATAVVVIFAVALVFYIVTQNHKKNANAGGPGDTVHVTTSKLITKPGTTDAKATVTFYEDFLCPSCGHFEQTFGPTISNLIDIGAIAADYRMVAILDSPHTNNYSSRAGGAALCAADESIDGFRRFHTALYSANIQPSERASSFPDNNKLIEIAREAGVGGKVPDCINSGKYQSKVAAEADLANVHQTPTILINGQEFDPTGKSGADFVAAIKAVVGDVPGIDTAAAPPQQTQQ
jgi:protein-disulfide isomerase